MLIKRFFQLLISSFIAILLLVEVGAAQHIPDAGGMVNFFENDMNQNPFPADRNAKIIEEKELIQKLPEGDKTSRVYISKIEFSGNRIFSKEELSKLVVDYLYRDLSIIQLNQIADIITRFYRQKGYAISYAYVAPQVIQNSTLNLTVVEGKVGKIEIEGLTDYKKAFVLKHLKMLENGLILDTNFLERRLLLLNTFMDLKVNATLRPGSMLATSDIIISAEDTKPYRFSFSADNYGNYQTDEYRLNAAGAIGNVLTSGDRLALNASLGLESLNPLDLFFARIDYKFPLGYNGLKMGFFYARGDYGATKDFKPLGLRGSSNEASMYFEYPLVLRVPGNLYLGAAFNFRHTEDKILSTTRARDFLTNLKLSLYGSAYPWQGAIFYYNLTYNQGLNPIFKASHFDMQSSNPYASGWNSKFHLKFEYHQFITWYLRTRLLFNAQWVSGTAHSAECFFVGGMYSVRGFDNGLESGDYGYNLSVEVEVDVVIPHIKFLIFYDRGQVGNDNVQFSGFRSADLDGVGGGFHFYPYKGLSIKLEYAYPIRSSRQHVANPSWGKIYGRLAYEF